MKKQLSKWQKSFILDGFDDPLRIAITGIGSGKSYALSLWIVLQCIKKPGIRGIMIAQNYRALTLVLIREIKIRCGEFGIRFNHNKGNNEILFENGSVLYGFTAESPDAILGLTEMDMLTMDEAAYCNEEIYNNAKDRLRGGKYKPMTRLISSPNSMSKVQNWFSGLCKKHNDCVIHATSLDNPFTSDEFKQELKERYGEGSNLYKQQVLGEILDVDAADQIIFRHEFPDKKNEGAKEFFLGYDASGMGADTDQFVIVDKFGMVDSDFRQVSNTFEKADIITKFYDKYKVKFGNVDGTGGYSQGVFDIVVSKGYDIGSINFAQKAIQEDKYPNARTEMYLELAKAVKDGFWVDDEVKEEMLAQSVFINNKGQQQLVPKEDVKKVLGHSPDKCDAVALAVYAMNHSKSNIMTDKQAEAVADEYLRLMGY
jgi:PBSX family phage terminase large subunit